MVPPLGLARIPGALVAWSLSFSERESPSERCGTMHLLAIVSDSAVRDRQSGSLPPPASPSPSAEQL